MVIKARYENGVFKPLSDVPVKEGAIVDLYVRQDGKEKGTGKSLTDYAACGMWADRTDFQDGEDYVNRIRKYRR